MDDSKIWTFLIGVLVLFTGVILFARHVTIQKQNSYQPVVARYSNYTYRINLRYPPEWQPVGGGEYDRYDGPDGFFGVSAGGVGRISLADMVESETVSQKYPYGKTPTVLDLKIDGQEAKLIMPSPDQDPTKREQAELIVRYPEPVTIGTDTFNYFIFWADRTHIQDIASSITFIRDQTTQ